MALKTNKELAFLHELFVATDWGERFAELIDEHVKLPKAGRALYVGSGTGGHAIALQERASAKLSFLGVDESEENLELARVKAKAAVKNSMEFRKEKLDKLTFEECGIGETCNDYQQQNCRVDEGMSRRTNRVCTTYYDA